MQNSKKATDLKSEIRTKLKSGIIMAQGEKETVAVWNA